MAGAGISLDGENADGDMLVFAEPVHAAQAEHLLQRKVGLLTRTQLLPANAGRHTKSYDGGRSRWLGVC